MSETSVKPSASGGTTETALDTKDLTAPDNAVKDGTTDDKDPETPETTTVTKFVQGGSTVPKDLQDQNSFQDTWVPPEREIAPGFLLQLVEALKQFFNPGGDQVFTLQFPGRFLSQELYAWDTKLAGVYGQFVKPVAVNESEFRLADQLYDLADRVGGPNGTNLSIVYEQLLNNMLPKHEDNGLSKQQDQIRQWLTQNVPMSQWIKDIMKRHRERGRRALPYNGSGNDNKSEALNRIELSGLLMNEYLYAKQDWELERDRKISEASQTDISSPEGQKKLNDLTRELVHITAARQAQLASKYSDAVVRGYTHAIKEYMGYMDISSTSEALQNAKDSLRESAMSSLDGAMKVYPVQFTPLDWFEGLSTSFTMEDLTQNPEMIRMQIDAKSQQLDTLNSQLMVLQMGAKGNPKELEAQVEEAQLKLDAAQSTLARTYSYNIISMAKTFLSKEGKVNIDNLAGKLGISVGALGGLQVHMDAVRSAQDSLASSSRALAQLRAAHALANATDTKQQQQYIRTQIQTISKELKELEIRWVDLTGETGGVNPKAPPDTSNENIPTTPIELPPHRTSGGGRWQELHFTSDAKTRKQFSSTHAEGSGSQWNCDLWFASGRGSSSRSAGESESESTATDDTIDLALRCTQVTIDRGGWFQPQFFIESKAFYKINQNITWNKTGEIKGLMEGFPVSFVIAKDIVIRIRHAKTYTTEQKTFDASSYTTSGGFLCFSYSKSSSSTSESQSSSFQAFSDGFIVKIPGPQILGYTIEKTPPDMSEAMPQELPDNFLIPGNKSGQELVQGFMGQGGNRLASEAVSIDPTGVHTIGEVPIQEVPRISVDRLRDVVGKILDERLDNIFDKIKDEAGQEGEASTSGEN